MYYYRLLIWYYHYYHYHYYFVSILLLLLIIGLPRADPGGQRMASWAVLLLKGQQGGGQSGKFPVISPSTTTT